nr:cyclic nucleotide-binding domain-containing protein [Gammaproteobacteria bacterium]
MLVESMAGTAFLMGIISACSLPLGALTSAFWRPADRVVAFLMAFGGGALLAALTIDLVGAALARGHFYFLAFGCILGGLLFVALNEIVNDYGGFLRKASTTIYHLRRKEYRRFKRVFSGLGRLDIFKEVSASEFKGLVTYIRSESYKQGSWIFRPGDPSDALYVVADGEVELLIAKHETQSRERLGRNDAFGRLAFLTGTPHANGTLAARDTTLWVLPRVAFVHLLPNSPTLQQAVHRWLRSDELYHYLQECHGMTAEQAQRWTDAAVASLGARGSIPPAVEVARNDLEFRSVANQISRLPIFADLPANELGAIASRILFKRHQRGETFFYPGDPADRLYIIERGEVSLLDPRRRGEKPTYLHDHDAFGALSFLTGARHSVSAVATEDTTLWVLRKTDFEDLLRRTPALSQHVKVFLQRMEVVSYLQRKQHFDHDAAARWTAKAVRDIDSGKLMPAIRMTKAEIEQHGGAALAIWLGIMLDGVPESLVIGASLIHSQVSLSLLAGLFLSNYPEALSSSIGMRQQGFSINRIVLMWTSLMLLTGIGAALGNLFFRETGAHTFAVVEGIAAGAMLTMIAQTMLPEAYFKGGSIIGFSTLLGFLAAIFFKTLD